MKSQLEQVLHGWLYKQVFSIHAISEKEITVEITRHAHKIMKPRKPQHAVPLDKNDIPCQNLD
jgi:hypothetical protein